MNNKLVSVIIPSYNVESYIKECIDSMLNQTYENIEILIYDDGSTDETLSVLKKLVKHKKIKVFSSNINRGASYARNFLFNKAQGEYIMLQDSDDKSLKSRIENCLKFLEDSDYIFTSCNIQTDRGNIFNYSCKDEYMVAIRQFQCFKPLGGASSFFHRCVIDYKIRYDENLLAGEDVLFDVHVQEKFPLKLIGFPMKTPYYWYRKRNNSLTSIRKKENLTPESVMNERNSKIKKIMSKVLLDNKEKFLSYFKNNPSMYVDEIKKLFNDFK